MKRSLAGLVAALVAGAALAQPILAGPGASAEETDYALQCRGCHGPDGAGVPGLVPPLTGIAELLATPAGRAPLLTVPGVRQASLSDERLAALLLWLAAPASPPIGDVLQDIKKLAERRPPDPQNNLTS